MFDFFKTMLSFLYCCSTLYKKDLFLRLAITFALSFLILDCRTASVAIFICKFLFRNLKTVCFKILLYTIKIVFEFYSHSEVALTFADHVRMKNYLVYILLVSRIV